MRLTAFVASSSENLHIAHAIQENLEAREIVVTCWDQSDSTSFVLDALTAELMRVDFGIFVFTPDDKTEIREASTRSVRDNVLFELGLFIGRFGRERAFIVTPRGHQDMRIPTDIRGLNLIQYDGDRPDDKWHAGLASACRKCLDRMMKLGPNPEKSDRRVSPVADWRLARL